MTYCRRLSFKLGREARFSGPLLVEVSHRLPYTSTPPDRVRNLDHLSQTLAQPHRATISLSFVHVPAALIQQLMVHGGCSIFPRIARLTVDFLSTEEEERLSPQFQGAWPQTPSTPPQLPLLRVISIQFNHSYSIDGGLGDLETARNSREWGWLFTPATMQQLRSYDSTMMSHKDFSWLLSEAPELKELSSTCADTGDNESPPNPILIISHPKLRRMTISSWSQQIVFNCPSLSSLVNYWRSGCSSTGMSPQTVASLTALSLPFAGDNSSAMPPFRSLQSISHLTINYNALSSFADSFQDPSICPALRSLVVRFPQPTAADPNSSGYLQPFGDAPTVARLLSRLVAPRPGGVSGIQELDLRFERPISEYQRPHIREDFVKMYRLLHPNNFQEVIPEIPLDIGIKSIRKCLDGGRRVCSA